MRPKLSEDRIERRASSQPASANTRLAGIVAAKSDEDRKELRAAAGLAHMNDFGSAPTTRVCRSLGVAFQPRIRGEDDAEF